MQLAVAEGGEQAERGRRALSWVLAVQIVAVILAFAWATIPEMQHWLVAPLFACGVLTAVDIVDWARRRLDLLDPQAVIGIFAFHLCFLSPILHFAFDHWPSYVAPAAHWPDAMAQLALLNAGGLALYRLILARSDRPAAKPTRQFDEARFAVRARVVAGVGLLVFVIIVIQFGGPIGYVNVMTEGRESLVGYGGLLIVAESFPLVMFALVAVRYREKLRSRPALVILMVVLFVLAQFVAGGLRGSRSNTVWPTLISIGIVHLVIRPVPRRTLVAWALVLGVFMYIYGFYKTAGTDALDLLARGTSIERLTEQTGRSLPLLLLEDFSRAGVQAIVVDRLDSEQAELGSGVTYVGDASILVPRSILLERPPDKVAVGTDILYGPGTYETGFRSSHIYGLLGEAAINFGPWPAMLAFAVLGIYIRFARRFYRQAQRFGSLPAGILGPALSVSSVLVLGSDLDNVVWFTAKHTLPLAIVLYPLMPVLRRAEQPADRVVGGHLEASRPTP